MIFIKEVLVFQGFLVSFLAVFMLLTILYYVWRSIIHAYKNKKFIDSYRSSKKEEELDKSGNYWICKSCNIKIENQFSECWSCTNK